MRVVVLISGGGTTLQNFIDQVRAHTLEMDIAGVVSSRADAFGLERARQAGIPAVVVPRQPAETFAERVFTAIRAWSPDLVCLAGWLHLLPIPRDFQNRVVNIHPSLLPAFGGQGMYGMHVHQAVLDSGAKITGCTVHFADDTYDTGPIIVQKTVPVLDTDTPQTLAERVYKAECEAYPEALRILARGQWVIEGRRVIQKT